MKTTIKKGIINNYKIKIFIFLFLCFYFYSIKFKNCKEIEKNNNLKVCLCLICKEEKLYIKDFIEYYKQLGFTHIFLYDNNDKNGENIKEVISDFIEKKFITYINFRDFKKKLGGPIMAAYLDCYHKNNLLFDWIAFFDVDEYLTFDPNNLTLQNFLNNPRFKDCESIKINWRVFTDDNKLDYENKPLYERFTKPTNISTLGNQVTKIIIRGNITNYSSRILNQPHIIFDSNKSCDTNGIKRNGFMVNPPVYNNAILNHYFTKTIKEYINKIKRGHSFYQWKIDKKVYEYYFIRFFRYNKKTKEKLYIFNKAFKTNYK